LGRALVRARHRRSLSSQPVWARMGWPPPATVPHHAPGVQVSEVAARYGFHRSLVFQWRRQARDGLLVAEPTPEFVPVRVAVADRRDEMLPEPEPTPPSSPSCRKTAAIEIERRTASGCGLASRSVLSPCGGCWRRCAGDPGTAAGRAGLAGRGRHRHAARLRRSGAAGAGGAGAGSVQRPAVRVPRPPWRSRDILHPFLQRPGSRMATSL
jgi:transposase-like protein